MDDSTIMMALASLTGAAISLLFSYVPGLKDWFNAFKPDKKRLFMAGIMLLVAAALFGLSCSGFISTVACTKGGVWSLIIAYISALIANQTAYSVTPRGEV